MRRQHDKRPAIAFLVGVVGLLLALNLYLLQSPVDISPLDQAKGRSTAPTSPNLGLSTPLDTKPATQFQELVARPLFNPSRKPIKREAVTDEAVKGQPSELRLVGVMKSGDSPARALIRFADGQTGKWLAEGEQVNGWTLRKIGDRDVTIEASGRSHELTLAAPRPAADTVPAPVPGRKRR
jgi:hypothetical protein